MTSSDAILQSLRHRIDDIDDQVHDLIMARCALVAEIAAAKAGQGLPLRPGREAEILRRLAARHQGPFPKATLVRIWRELIGAVAGLQAPMTIAVAGEALVDLARAHFGVASTVTATASPGQVVKLVSEGSATVGVLPMPAGPVPAGQARGDETAEASGQAEPWWRILETQRGDMPRVVTRLPIYAAGADGAQALVIAGRPHDDTGDDRTLLVVEANTDVSRDRLRTLLAAAGFDGVAFLGGHAAGGSAHHLVEVVGWLDGADPRLAQIERDPIQHAGVIGGYPVPLPP